MIEIITNVWTWACVIFWVVVGLLSLAGIICVMFKDEINKKYGELIK